MIAIVSYVSVGAYDSNTVDEDKILSSILEDLGIPHEIMPWSDSTVNWSKYSGLLIKSTWDYFDYYPEFLAWIEKIKKLEIPVWNDLDTVLWNSSKSYLKEIESKGFPVVSGIELKRGEKVSFEFLENKIATDYWVVKPLVSGGAKNTLKFHKSDWDKVSQKVQELVDQEDFLIQPFIKEVQEVGEYSLLFFNGEFSHAVLKSPAKEDFRVQHYFGGTIHNINPSEEMKASALSLVQEFASKSLYARVDGVDINGVFHLMELELIEPYLFLALDEKAIPNYKRALAKRLL